jgi:alkanesulfonate monooxygenase SsuD/methylene tetrahydromethanopterin reductase-like flavin-dependent oxidoreductase (luciferase family)
MRLGVSFSHPDLGNDPGFLKEFAQAVEGAGFDHLLAAEHVVGGHPDRAPGEKIHTYDIPYHEPFVLFGFLGAVTTTLELVTSILILPQRQTVLVAKQAAELDLLTGGRLRLGVGVGRNWMEYEALNEDFTNRGARIEEQAGVLRRLWSEELVPSTGRGITRPSRSPTRCRCSDPSRSDGLVRGPCRREGDPPHRPAGRRMVPADVPGRVAPVLEQLRGYAVEAGRDPHRSVSSAASASSATTAPTAGSNEPRPTALGATHLRAMTAAGGFGAERAPRRRPAVDRSRPPRPRQSCSNCL